MHGELRERTFGELSEAECWDLLATQVVGRLAVNGDAGAAPLVIPVNYIVDGRSIVFRSAQGAKLSLVKDRAVAFEVDHLDHGSNSGWSVLVRGRAIELTHWESDHLIIETWAPGERTHFVRIAAGAVTGRKITPDQWIDHPKAYL